MISVCVPYSPAPGRARLLDFVHKRYAELGWEVVVGETEAPWCKARAVQKAVDAATGSVLVVADGDVWAENIRDFVAGFDGAWGVPHRMVHRYSPEASDAILAGGPWAGRLVERHVGMPGGGIVVVRRDVWQEAPIDPRFVGWGGEDAAWGIALRALFGRPLLGGGVLHHLWHPPQDRESRMTGSRESQRIVGEWRRAKRAGTVRDLTTQARKDLTLGGGRV